MVKKLAFVLCIVLVNSFILSQTPEIVSAKLSTQAVMYYKKGSKFQDRLLEKALKQFKMVKSELGSVVLLRTIAKNFHVAEKYESMKEIYGHAIEVIRKSKDENFRAFHLIDIFFQMVEIEKKVSLQKLVNEIIFEVTRINDPERRYACLKALALTFWQQKKFKVARIVFFSLASTARKIQNPNAKKIAFAEIQSLSGKLALKKTSFPLRRKPVKKVGKIVERKYLDTINFRRWLYKTFRVSPNNERILYIMTKQVGKANHFVVRVNSFRSKAYKNVASAPIFSPNSLHVAAIVTQGKKWSVAVNGECHTPYNFIVKTTLAFSPDSKHIAYMAKKGSQFVFVLDGKEVAFYEDCSPMPVVFGPASKQIAYGIWKGNKNAIVLNGKVQKYYDNIGSKSFTFSPDGKRTLYGVREGKKWFMVIDGKEQKKYDAVLLNSYFFSPDSKHFMYGAKKDKKWFMVIDGKEQQKFDTILSSTIKISPDGKRLAYVAKRNGTFCLVLDNKVIPDTNYVILSTMTFSPDSKQFVYGLIKDKKSWMILHGKPQKIYNGIIANSVVFSPDSKRIAYAAIKGRKTLVIVDGVEQKAYKSLVKNTLAFSPDSKHIVYGMIHRGKQIVLVNGKETHTFASLVNLGGGKVKFVSNDVFQYLALVGSSIFSIKQKIE